MTTRSPVTERPPHGDPETGVPTASPTAATTTMSKPHGSVVAVVLTHAGRLCLLRRSRAVGSDRGRWHCVTGYVPHGTDPAGQAMTEVEEETGLAGTDLRSFTPGRTLRLPDSAGRPWTVFTFRCEVSDPRIRINWEHDAYAWVPSIDRAGGAVVPWLRDVMNAVA